jgi:hypothetical protein
MPNIISATVVAKQISKRLFIGAKNPITVAAAPTSILPNILSCVILPRAELICCNVYAR